MNENQSWIDDLINEHKKRILFINHCINRTEQLSQK